MLHIYLSLPHHNISLVEMSEKQLIVINNVRVFDGLGNTYENGVVIVNGKFIEFAGSSSEAQIPVKSKVIDGSGLTAMPGLIDAHLHLVGLRKDMFREPWILPYDTFVARVINDLRSLIEAGFTTVRDCGSMIALRLKPALNEGTIIGPRIVASGPIVTQTFGHGDEHYLPIEWVDLRTTRKMMPFGTLICDGPSECRKAARYALREGADFIKICTTGGVLSQRDRPDYVQFTLEEIRAIVEEAEAAKKFVAAHAEGTEGIKNALKGGVKTIEHGELIDDEGIQLALEKNAIIVTTLSIDEHIIKYGKELNIPDYSIEKEIELSKEFRKHLSKAYKAGVKMATGTDFTGGVKALRQGDNALEITLLVEKLGFTPKDALIAATRNAAEAAGLLNVTGTLEKGKFADLILVKGNPLHDTKVLMNKDNIVLVMKEGQILKNLLSS